MKANIVNGITTLLIGLFCFVQNGYGVIIHNDGNDQDYINLGNQYGSTVFAGGTLSDGGYPIVGSGVVIDDGHWVVSSSHCYLDSNGQLEFAGAWIGTGDHVYNNPGTYHDADQIFTYPSYSGAVYGPDICLLYFEEKITGVTPATRFRENLELGILATTVGYGDFGTPASGNQGYDGQRRGCQNVIDSIGLATYPEYSIFTGFYPEGHDDYNSLGGMGAAGDSGGGLFVEVDGEYQLAGITVGASDPQYYGYTVSQDITYFNDWIDTTIASVPEPASIMLVGIFGGALLFIRRHLRI